VLEPVKGYQRNAQFEGTYTSFSPFTRVVDAARPDQKVARDFRNNVDKYIKDTEQNTEDIKYILTLWKNNHSKLMKIISQSPILEEITPMSEMLSEISQIGLEALEKLENDEKAGNRWKKKSRDLLKKAEAPHGQTELMIVTAIEKLVDAL